MTKRLIGYADAISVPPGGSIAFKVSSETDEVYNAAIVRLINGDTNPAGPGYREYELRGTSWQLQGRRQLVRCGSCIIIPSADKLRGLSSFVLDMLIWPTTPGKAGQVLASLWDDDRRAGFILSLDGENGISLQLGDGEGGSASVCLGAPVLERRWYRIHAVFDAVRGRVELRQSALRRLFGTADHGFTEQADIAGLGHPASSLILAARAASDGNGFQDFYNGKIEALRIDSPTGDPIGIWDFALGIGGDTIQDISGNGLHGRTWQKPTRAMTGHCWDGTENNWRHEPSQYGAIHFHDDDLQDAGWETDFVWHVPPDLKSGLYAARLNSAQDEDYIPFVVRPAPGASTMKLLFIVPTASYLAYANEHMALDAFFAEGVHDHVPVFGPNDVYLAAHRELGGSLYDRHSDGSSIFYSSRLRPILNMRPKYQSWLGGGTGSGLWQLNADTHLIAWLEKLGIPFDCITDEDLDREGVAALQPYTCVMTGTHPEYWSTRMLDALGEYRDSSGRIMYMGGNGFYWRIAFDPEESGTIEVRRSEIGNGTAPGESYQVFNGEYGGLWRRLARPPQETVGVGFVGQGFDVSSYYRRLPDSYNQRATFIFDGVADEMIGDFGLIGGGAAGIELDRTDPAQGTPPNTLILARSEHHTACYLPSLETLPINYINHAAISPIYAEMVFFETPAGGAVFSTGSIAWAGSLSHNDYDNNVAHITANVLRRFLEPEPFTAPSRSIVEEIV